MLSVGVFHQGFLRLPYTMINRLFILFLLLPPPPAFGFVNVNIVTRRQQCHHRFHSDDIFMPLRLIPLTNFVDSISFFSEPEDYRCCVDGEGYFRKISPPSSSIISERTRNNSERYELGLIEEEELPELCNFVVTTFGADAIQLSKDMNSFERMIMNPAAQFLNGYSGLVAFAEVFSGTRQRLADRFHEDPSKIEISAPDFAGMTREERIRKAERDSLILVLARRTTSGTDGGGGRDSNASLDVIASIELRLQPCDAKIPFSIPWFDRLERRVGSYIGLGNVEVGSNDLQPYLSNLCVDENFRGQKIGRGLVRCVENIAKTCWGFSRIYLHVDEDNLAALNLYKSEGYRDVGHRWNPFWSGRSSDIGYYVKSLS